MFMDETTSQTAGTWHVPPPDRLFTAVPCDHADAEPGVRLLRGGKLTDRLSRIEALVLANELLDAILTSVRDDER